MGVDNALITRELRKLFSQELGWAPRELHEKGTVLQLEKGSSTGMTPKVVRENIEFLDEDFSEQTGMKVETPWDREGADVLLIHNAGEILSWPENPAAFAILMNAAGISWTLSSEDPGYDGVNYGLFYDDVQLARVALRHAEIAKKLGVKKIVMGECGHQHKAFMTIADRILTGDLNIPRESSMTFLENIVFSGKVDLDPSRNDFPVTLHDPCNIVRNLGIVEPQRRILRKLCPQFREMTPHGVDNYCCGGGSGLAVMSSANFKDWRVSVAGRRKFRQILEAFADCPGADVNKYVCAPCSNCKGQITGHPGLLRRHGKIGHPLRRARRAHRQRHDRAQKALYRLRRRITRLFLGDHQHRHGHRVDNVDVRAVEQHGIELASVLVPGDDQVDFIVFAVCRYLTIKVALPHRVPDAAFLQHLPGDHLFHLERDRVFMVGRIPVARARIVDVQDMNGALEEPGYLQGLDHGRDVLRVEVDRVEYVRDGEHGRLLY